MDKLQEAGVLADTATPRDAVELLSHVRQPEPATTMDEEALLKQFRKQHTQKATSANSAKKTERLRKAAESIVKGWAASPTWKNMSVRDARTQMRIHCQKKGVKLNKNNPQRDVQQATELLAEAGVLPAKFKKSPSH